MSEGFLFFWQLITILVVGVYLDLILPFHNYSVTRTKYQHADHDGVQGAIAYLS